MLQMAESHFKLVLDNDSFIFRKKPLFHCLRFFSCAHKFMSTFRCFYSYSKIKSTPTKKCTLVFFKNVLNSHFTKFKLEIVS